MSTESVAIVIDVAVHGEDAMLRGICDHEDGRWSIVKTNAKGEAPKVEQTFTLDEARDWAAKALAGDPDVRTRKGLGPMLSASVLIMMVAAGLIQTKKDAA